jgi:molybdenum cofactor cytidylyltransferase
MNEIWAIILAAGESVRMGFPKMLLKFNGQTMLEEVIGNVTRSDVDNTMVVLGADREVLTEIVEKFSVHHCYNSDYKKGMLSSVKCGSRNIPSDFEAVLVFQGDQHLIKPTVINSIIEAYRSSDKGIVIPVFENKRGHPLLIAGKYRDEIDKLDAQDGLRSLSYKFSNDVLEVITNDSGILRDIDTYDDYREEISQIM